MTRSAEFLGRTLVIAPHPDDEVLGAGGTIARLANAGQDVYVAVVTTGMEPDFDADAVRSVKREAALAHEHLGVRRTYWLEQPAAHLFETPHVILNAAIATAVGEVNPDTMIIPFVGDIHMDHQLTFLASMVSARPHQQKFPATILAYETTSETNWNAPYLTPGFLPNVFIDIEATLSKKLEAMRLYQSQLRQPPHERSLAALQALATMRGATIHRHAAEAFVMIRHVVN